MYPERIKKMIAIGAGEQIPGLRKVVLILKNSCFRPALLDPTKSPNATTSAIRRVLGWYGNL
jgi:hypothetical protein